MRIKLLKTSRAKIILKIEMKKCKMRTSVMYRYTYTQMLPNCSILYDSIRIETRMGDDTIGS